jgi:hypothetical protein
MVSIINYYFYKTKADIIGVAFYLPDTPNLKDLYIQFMYQKVAKDIIPIPNARYSLSQNNLLDRYRVHNDGDCFKRTFEQTNTTSFSCGLFDKDTSKLYGFITIEFLNSRSRVLPSRRFLEFYSRFFSTEASSQFLPVYQVLKNNK